jgi:predicted RNA binding protein YcfA (HicA-like mRNA interferase family)
MTFNKLKIPSFRAYVESLHEMTAKRYAVYHPESGKLRYISDDEESAKSVAAKINGEVRKIFSKRFKGNDWTEIRQVKESEIYELEEAARQIYTMHNAHKTLKKAGFSIVRSNGGHDVFEHDDGRSIPIPRHKGDLSIGVSRQIKQVLEKK